MYYFVVNNLFLCFVIISTLHISGTICQDENIPDDEIWNNVEKLKKHCKRFHHSNRDLEIQISGLRTKIERMEKRMNFVTYLQDDTIRTERRCNVILRNVPPPRPGETEDTASLVTKFETTFDYRLQPIVFSCYRMNNKKKQYLSTTVIMRFINFESKMAFYEQCGQRRFSDSAFGGTGWKVIKVNHHLSPRSANILALANNMREVGFKLVYDEDNDVYIKRNETESPIRVISPRHLINLYKYFNGTKQLQEFQYQQTWHRRFMSDN